LCGNAVDGPLRLFPRKKSINQAGRKGVAATNAVVDVQIFASSRLVESAIVIADCYPVVHGGCPGIAQSRGDDRELGKILHHFFDHSLEIFRIKFGMLLIDTGHLIAESGSEVFFVSEHHIDKRSKTPIDFLGFGFSANRFPQRRTIVQIIGNAGACTLRRFHCLLSDERSSVRKRTINSAGVKPARSVLAENFLPVDFAGLQLRDSGVAAIRTSQGSAQAEASLGKIQTVPDRASHAVKGHPADIFLTDASLEDQIFYKAANWIVRKGGYDGRIHPKAPAEAAGDVVFASPFPCTKMARGGDALVAWVEPQHYFAKADQVPHATVLQFDIQLRHA